jgi:hypothetical protein
LCRIRARVLQLDHIETYRGLLLRGVEELKRGSGWVMNSLNVWIISGLFETKDSKLRCAVINKEGCHDYTFSSMDILLENNRCEVVGFLIDNKDMLLSCWGL